MKKTRLLKKLTIFKTIGVFLLMGLTSSLNAQDQKPQNYAYSISESFSADRKLIPIGEIPYFSAKTSYISHSETLRDRIGNTPVIMSETIYMVENTNDSGTGSLRWAIEQVNGNDGGIIHFNITGTPPFVIQPVELLLPSITKPVVIDGTSHPAYQPGAPVVVIDGSVIGTGPLGRGSTGLRLTEGSSGSTIRGLVIINFEFGEGSFFGFNGMGISVETDNNIIESNFIGISHDGTTPAGNATGIEVEGKNNTIGGDTAEKRNVISGNISTGLLIGVRSFGSSGNTPENNLVIGNFLGTNAAGTTAVSNIANIQVTVDAANTIIGGTNENHRNIISGATNRAIVIASPTNVNTSVKGNYIGTDVTGTVAIPNNFGIHVLSGAVNTMIGGEEPGAGNVISGSSNWAIGFQFDGQTADLFVTGTQIKGNFIGTDAGGMNALPNNDGIFTYNHTQNISIGGQTPAARNIISGNLYGIDIGGENVSGNSIKGNYIGTNATGTEAIPNTFGIRIFQSHSNIIGGETADERNLLSGNSFTGLAIVGALSVMNQVKGNYIGLNAAGNQAVPNSVGVSIDSSANNNLIGGPTDSARNIISGNSNSGIQLSGQTHSNVIQNNYIGTNTIGTSAIGNGAFGINAALSNNNEISGNLISGNGSSSQSDFRSGIFLNFSSGNLIKGNLIGTNNSGNEGIPNDRAGIYLSNSAENHIGGNNQSERNIISANSFAGIILSNAESTGNIIQDNFIGSDISGSAALGNGVIGITLESAPGNQIINNLISGNSFNSAIASRSGLRLLFSSNNTIKGNLIGTNSSGSESLSNNHIGLILWGSNNNNIGGTIPGDANVISGNGSQGIWLTQTSNGNIITGNKIGTDITGTLALSNFDGIDLSSGSLNQIGGTGPGEGNLISGNSRHGISIFDAATQNQITGNVIGLNSDATAKLGNSSDGLFVRGAQNTIRGNIIAGNSFNGIQFQGSTASAGSNNLVIENYIGTTPEGQNFGNSRSGVFIFGGSNNRIGSENDNEANVIAFNTWDGVRITNLSSFVPAGNRILGNSIYSNSLQGIDLGGNGITPNDPDDADTGPNNLQNFPEISQASVGGGQLNVSYFVPSLPGNSAYPIRVEFFVTNPNERQGKTFLGFDEFTTADYNEGSKSASFSLPAGINLEPGNQLTATATDANGNTSHFGTLVESDPGVEVYTLTLLANPEEGGSVTGAGDYEDGTEVTVNAVPAEGYFFVNWTDLEDNVVSVVPQNDITITGDLTLIANFELIPLEVFTLTLLANPEEGGSVTGAGDYEDGTVVTVNAVPAEGYFFVNWTDLEDNVVSVVPQNDIPITGDLTLTANFELIPLEVFTLTLLANPVEGGFVTGAGNYEDGTVVTVNAVPAEGYFFVNWTDLEDNVVSVVPQNDIPITGDLTLTANFMVTAEDVLCSYSQGYWFARPQTIWPYDVEVGGWTFTQQDGQAFWPPNNNTKRAFTQYATIYLSGVTVSLFPELQEAMETIEYYFANVYPAMADRHVNRAAGYIGDWVDENHCDDIVYYSNEVDPGISSDPTDENNELQTIKELWVNAYPNPFRNEAIIEFIPVFDSDATIEVFNMIGERVRVLFEGPVNAFETYQVKMDSRDLPNGVYFYRLKTGNQTYLDKIILAR